MGRVRPLLGLIAVALGVAIAVDGVGALRRVLELAVDAGPFLLIGLGAVALLRSLAPTSAWAGAGVLVVAGTIWLLADLHHIEVQLSGRLAAVALIMVGLALTLVRPARGVHATQGVMGRTAVVFAREWRVGADAPPQLIARAFLTQLTTDLSAVRDASRLAVLVTILSGRCEMIVPDDWLIIPGRLDAARGIRIDDRRQARPLADADAAPLELTIHVSGFLGTVLIRTS